MNYLTVKPEGETCPKCRTKDFSSCHSMQCPMRISVGAVEDKQESQDDLWMEAINETLKLDFRESRIKWLKERFTITRKEVN